jgi:hypothetical protein
VQEIFVESNCPSEDPQVHLNLEMAIIESTSTSAKNVRKESSVARIVGSGSAGILELAFFHPVRTSPEDNL